MKIRVLEGFLEELVFELSLEECARISSVSEGVWGQVFWVGRMAHAEGRRERTGVCWVAGGRAGRTQSTRMAKAGGEPVGMKAVTGRHL